ncbi:MAG: protocatechuate 3,4-dioxygenase beta subunit [Gammaproteobacteria bacterium]|jgi:protocatechuate 3,4-dioxygenase beta subunit
MSNDRSKVFLPRNRAQHPPAFAEEYKSSKLRSPQHPLILQSTTVTEESGPVFGSSFIGPKDDNLIVNYASGGKTAIGQRILVHGYLKDQNGRAIPESLVEIWQANAGGRYRHKNERYLAELDPNFGGCGRCLTDQSGYYQFKSILPGAYPWPNGPNSWRPAHIHFSLFGHSFAQRLITQMYFEGDPLIADCPIVNAIPDAAAIQSLVAQLDREATIPMDSLAYRFDITLRGSNQTYFENRREGL